METISVEIRFKVLDYDTIMNTVVNPISWDMRYRGYEHQAIDALAKSIVMANLKRWGGRNAADCCECTMSFAEWNSILQKVTPFIHIYDIKIDIMGLLYEVINH